ncbi:MAG: rhodanese-like domain-containing protein [Oscillospiraceae bacterium]|nr:rhodanese-like domain-containing protein [Oscillospiraceae bacterium]
MKNIAFILITGLALLFTSCASVEAPSSVALPAETPPAEVTPYEVTPSHQVADAGGMEKLPYLQIDQETAKRMMEADDGHVIVDVRRQDEYDAGHIPGAILIPNESIVSERPEELPDLQQIILIYCRSGRRSKEAAQKLADMGYVNIYEFGGIIDWTGEITAEAGTSDANGQPDDLST